MTEFMIDIETLSTRTNAVVLSIGAVEFTQDGGLVDSIISKPDLWQQVNAHRHISPNTLGWWSEQDSAPLKQAFSKVGRKPVRECLVQLSDFIKPHCLVWANSPSFDAVILESLYQSAKLDPPWEYYSLRDCRTIKDAAGLPSSWAPRPSGYKFVPHDPVSDCIWQVEMVRHCRIMLSL
jgi:hypothetical protein